MALLNRFLKLNDRGETGVFSFIVTRSVTRDLKREATTKDFCFGFHRWAVSFQRPSERSLGVHLLLRNPSPSTACLVDFTLTLVNRRHFSQNEVFTKRQAKFTITNSMQGVGRWIEMADLVERRFCNESGEFMFELTLSNMSTVFECDVQLGSGQLSQLRSMMLSAPAAPASPARRKQTGRGTKAAAAGRAESPLSLETNYFTFGAFDWSLAIVPLVIRGAGELEARPQPEPVCRVYLNRLTGMECLCRVKYRVILGHRPASEGPAPSPEFADSRLLDQISERNGRIRGHQFRKTNILKLIALRSEPASQQAASHWASAFNCGSNHNSTPTGSGGSSSSSCSGSSSLDLRVHIEMYCANTITETRVPLASPQARQTGPAQTGNCLDRNKQSWCLECDISEPERLRLRFFFLDAHSVPRNHVRYISWAAHLVAEQRRLHEQQLAARNGPHFGLYRQEGTDLGTIMETDMAADQLRRAGFLDETGHLRVHIEWMDSLLLFNHFYSSYDSLAATQLQQIRREFGEQQNELDELEIKYSDLKQTLDEFARSSAASSILRMEANKTEIVTFIDDRKVELESKLINIESRHQLTTAQAAQSLENHTFGENKLNREPTSSLCNAFEDDEPETCEINIPPRSSRANCSLQNVQASAFPLNDGHDYSIQAAHSTSWNGTTAPDPSTIVHDHLRSSYNSISPYVGPSSVCDIHDAGGRGSTELDGITSISPFGESQSSDQPMVGNNNDNMDLPILWSNFGLK